MNQGRNLYAVGNKIIAELINTATTTDGGIILSTAAQGITYEKAEVIGVGEDVCSVRAKDIVFIQKGAYRKLRIGSEDLLIIEESAVLALLRSES